MNEYKQAEFRKNIENCNKRIAEFEESKKHMQMMYNALKYEQAQKLNELSNTIEHQQRNNERI